MECVEDHVLRVFESNLLKPLLNQSLNLGSVDCEGHSCKPPPYSH